MSVHTQIISVYKIYKELPLLQQVLKISPSCPNILSIPAECVVVNSVKFISRSGCILEAYVVSWLFKSGDLFYTLHLLNALTNTSHNGINQENVGADDLGHRKSSRSASKITRTARVSS